MLILWLLGLFSCTGVNLVNITGLKNHILLILVLCCTFFPPTLYLVWNWDAFYDYCQPGNSHDAIILACACVDLRFVLLLVSNVSGLIGF